jgi:membrane protein
MPRERLRSALRFAARVASDFRRNRGFLLAGAVAYNTLLSIVPLFAVLLVALSHVVDERRLVGAVRANLALVFPPHAASALTDQVTTFLAHRQVVGGVSIVALLFFSSIAFSVLESAMAAIFHHRVTARRHVLVSAVLPYAFIMAVGAGLFLITVVSGALQVAGTRGLRLFGRTVSLAGASGTLAWLVGVAGLALLLTALYMVMPVGRVHFREALLGGVLAAALWELVRHALVWYLATLSSVNVIYGSLATAIVVLVTLEAAALVVLLGAQVIAELERRRSHASERSTPP